MPKEIYLLKVGMTMTEGMVSEWFVADGQTVNKGDMLYSLETEKVNMDVDADASGTVKHVAGIGTNMEPGEIIGFIFEVGEEIPATLKETTDIAPDVTPDSSLDQAPVPISAHPAGKAEPMLGDRIKSSPAARRLAGELDIDYTTLKGSGPYGRIIEADILAAQIESQSSTPKTDVSEVIKASPLAQRLAKEKGVDLAFVKGTGPGGRIIQADIEQAALGRSPQASSASVSSHETEHKIQTATSIPLKGMRKTIAKRMLSSLQNSAQLTMDMEVLMADAMKLRASMIQEWQSDGVKPSYTDLIVRAAAKALSKHRMMNAQFGDTEITLLADIHIGIAVALPEGLVVPVIRHADQLSLKQISIESARLALAARSGTLGLDDFAGGTFTISSLGMYGTDAFTPIINQPQAGILGVNRIYDGVEWNGDLPIKTPKMNLSLTWDHRVLDGAPAAEFLAEVRDILTNPYRLLV
jgi:pyruvate dehydrogenase E2 component (dihydrolipoamide acetyltransferase)